MRCHPECELVLPTWALEHLIAEAPEPAFDYDPIGLRARAAKELVNIRAFLRARQQHVPPTSEEASE